ncbi:diguanylate cyclase [Roseibium salinum]|nr:diguanylate cyclase [Roseibium salinum]
MTIRGAFLLIRANIPENRYAEYGFHASDEAVSLTAATIVSAVRSTDVVGRLGPDLFAVLLWGADEEEARIVGKRICENASHVQLVVDAPRWNA